MVSTRIATADDEIELPPRSASSPIAASADRAHRWRQGSYDVWWLRGHCRVSQGETTARAQEAILWVRAGDPAKQRQDLAIVYLEGDVVLDVARIPSRENREPRSDRVVQPHWLGEFVSVFPVRVDVANPAGEPTAKPGIFQRGMARREPNRANVIRRTQYSDTEEEVTQGDPLPSGTRRLRAFPRSGARPSAEWFPNESRDEWVAVITGGINLIIDGVDQAGTIDVSTDRMVIWTRGSSELDLSGQSPQDEREPVEIYMEGNIEFHQGERVIYAERMYYDVLTESGTVLAAEVLSPAPSYNGLLRLKADIARVAGRDRFFAENTFITSSRMGRPSYRLQSNQILVEDIQRPVVNPITGAPAINPETGEQVYDHQQRATSRNNFLFLGPVPVFYWPVLSTNLKEPTYYLRGAQVQTDRIFGTWAWAELDTFEVLGIQNQPEGTDWTFGFDYLSKRGFGGGTYFEYNRPDLFGIDGPARGVLDFFAIGDHGRDNLGRGRNSLVPEDRFRHRLRAQHRQQLGNDFQFSAEVGLISDRNFLEQYFESEWDQLKDQTTGAELKRITDNRSWSVVADARVNDFFTQTEWLPRADHFWLGQSLLGDRVSWFEHSQLAFARLRTATTPLDPHDSSSFALLPWERASTGGRFVTRQELDLPIDVGPVKVVPYILGELAHWDNDLSGNKLDRAFGQAGVRASIPFWAANPQIESQLFNVHGLAHKAVFDTEISFADATRTIDRLPLYDPLDDDAQEHFRRRLAFSTFGGATPLRFDERFYALRSGLQDWVTSPSTEIAGSLAAVRFGLRQRLQTKRGLPGQRRIIDWMVLDTELTWFPRANRDNFGSDFGLLNYDYRWHVGDRTTLLSSGGFDFFGDGQRIVTLGANISRPPRGNWYFGFRYLGGPIHSKVVTTSYSYRLSPKWVSTAGTSYDFGRAGNIGQSWTLTRVGESFLTSFAFYADAAKHNVGVNILIEPRFLPKTRLGRVAGVPIPNAGLFGLE